MAAVHHWGVGIKRPCRSWWTLAGMEARAISVKVWASRTSRKGETLGSGEMTEDRMTPAGKDEGGEGGEEIKGECCLKCAATGCSDKWRPSLLTVVLLHGSRRRDKHRLRGETRLLTPFMVFPGHHVHLRQLSAEKRKSIIYP